MSSTIPNGNGKGDSLLSSYVQRRNSRPADLCPRDSTGVDLSKTVKALGDIQRLRRERYKFNNLPRVSSLSRDSDSLSLSSSICIDTSHLPSPSDSSSTPSNSDRCLLLDELQLQESSENGMCDEEKETASRGKLAPDDEENISKKRMMPMETNTKKKRKKKAAEMLLLLPPLP